MKWDFLKVLQISNQGVVTNSETVRLVIATYLLREMLDTPTHGLQGQASKEVKVKAAFDYADLLLKG